MMRLSGEVVFLAVWMIRVSGSHPCPENCKVLNNSTLPTCDHTTPACSEGCLTGYYGNTCNMKCDVNCQRGKCQQRDGTCNCKRRYIFRKGSCVEDEGVRCKSNDHCFHNICLSTSRQDCLKGCKPGWYGKFCNQPCSSHCFCEQESGNCSSCAEGWYGAECHSSCSTGCSGKRCNENGTCVDGCTTGLYGERCELKCSPHCLSGCDQLSGECVQCEAGRYGSTCESKCNPTCARTNNDCNIDGSCIAGCIQGYHGQTCESKCSRRCNDGLCDSSTGECTKRCESGFFGLFCNLTCEDCEGGDCDSNTGECTGKWMTFIIGGGVLIIFGVLGVFIACCLKRMRDIVKDGVDTIGRNTAVQLVQSHGTSLRSVEIGNTVNNTFGSSSEDPYNHLFTIKPPEATFSLASDDLETSSGYCAVLPLFRGLSDQGIEMSGDRSNEGRGDLSDEGSGGRMDEGNVGGIDKGSGSGGWSGSGNDEASGSGSSEGVKSARSSFSRYDVNVHDLEQTDMEEARYAMKNDHIQEQSETVALDPLEEDTTKLIQMSEFQSDEEDACCGIKIEGEDSTIRRGKSTHGFPSRAEGEEETEEVDPAEVTDGNIGSNVSPENQVVVRFDTII